MEGHTHTAPHRSCALDKTGARHVRVSALQIVFPDRRPTESPLEIWPKTEGVDRLCARISAIPGHRAAANLGLGGHPGDVPG